MNQNRLPDCFHCGGPVHGGPCSQKTAEAPACQACLYRAAQDNGLCYDCERREQAETALTTGGATLLRYTAAEIRICEPSDSFVQCVADWLDNLADRWSHDATGSEMDAAEHIARTYHLGDTA